jgi:hypothetical protein
MDESSLRLDRVHEVCFSLQWFMMVSNQNFVSVFMLNVVVRSVMARYNALTAPRDE